MFLKNWLYFWLNYIERNSNKFVICNRAGSYVKIRDDFRFNRYLRSIRVAELEVILVGVSII